MTLPGDRPKVVFDCNTIVQAVAFEDSPAAACVRLVESAAINLLISKPIVRECRRVLGYQRLRERFPNLTEPQITVFLKRLTYRAVIIPRVPRAIKYPRDPDDEPYLDLVLYARADYLVTHDNDLLALASGQTHFHNNFRRRCPNLKILEPIPFLRAIGRPWRDGI